MQAFYSEPLELPLPPGHRFPMAKYRQLKDRVAAQAAGRVTLLAAPPASDDELRLAHSEAYVQRVSQGLLSELEQRRIGFPWSPELVARSRSSTGATIAALRVALSDTLAVNLAGGTHHAMADFGLGYCVFNDVAVAIRVLQAEQKLERCVVIDCDVHQGNGTASIFEHDRRVFTFSMHGARNFPFNKVPSDLDIALPDGTSDSEYLAALSWALDSQLPLAQADAVLYLAGADPYEGDRLGRLKLTPNGLRERDQLVFERCQRGRLPLAVMMAGGYADDIERIVEIHATTTFLAAESYWQRQT